MRTLSESISDMALDERRFRPNILIETESSGFPEDACHGQDFAVGVGARLRVVEHTERCVMVGLTQDELPDDPRILRAAARVNAACLGV
jgi:uncharacterized protein YcbX